jgi:hypothetical protein
MMVGITRESPSVSPPPSWALIEAVEAVGVSAVEVVGGKMVVAVAETCELFGSFLISM